MQLIKLKKEKTVTKEKEKVLAFYHTWELKQKMSLSFELSRISLN
jgi:hypothetical protein